MIRTVLSQERLSSDEKAGKVRYRYGKEADDPGVPEVEDARKRLAGLKGN